MRAFAEACNNLGVSFNPNGARGAPYMPNYRRVYVPGGTYFFTVKTFRRQRFLTDADVRTALRAGIQWTRQGKPFDIVAWVLLPDHLHCLWRLPPGDADFSARWSMIKRKVTQDCGERLNRPEWLGKRRLSRQQGTLWQHRFWDHLIRDENDFNRHMDYVHWNPVKHGLVAKVADWPYSSFHRLVRNGWYAANWGENIVFDDDSEFGEGAPSLRLEMTSVFHLTPTARGAPTLWLIIDVF